MNSIQKANIIKTIIIIGFALSVFYDHILSYSSHLNYYKFTHFYYHVTFYTSESFFGDFFYVFNNLFDPYNYQGSGIYYFPFTFFVLIPFKIFNYKIALVLYLIFFCLFMFFYVYKKIAFLSSSLADKLLSIFAFSFMTYPFLFAFTRANVEILSFIFLVLFIHFYQKKDDFKSILFLSFSAATKVYPLVFLVLFLLNKKFKNIIYIIILFLILSIVSTIPLKGGIANSFVGLFDNYKHMPDAIELLGTINHSVNLYAPIKISIYTVLGSFRYIFPISEIFTNKSTKAFHPTSKLEIEGVQIAAIDVFNAIYPFFVLLLLGLLLFFICKEEDIFWEKVFLLVSSMLLIPQISFDYKLVYLFIPMLLFINHRERRKNDLIYAVCFGLLMIPKDYILLGGVVSISSILNPLILIYMSILVVISGFKSSKNIL